MMQAKSPPTRISTKNFWLRNPTNISETEHLGAVATIKNVRSKRLSWEFLLVDSPQALSLHARISRQ